MIVQGGQFKNRWIFGKSNGTYALTRPNRVAAGNSPRNVRKKATEGSFGKTGWGAWMATELFSGANFPLKWPFADMVVNVSKSNARGFN